MEGGSRRLLVVLVALLMAGTAVLFQVGAVATHMAFVKEALALSLAGALVILAASILAHRELVGRIAGTGAALVVVSFVVMLIAFAAIAGWQFVWSQTGSYGWSLLGALAAIGLSILSGGSGPDWLVIIFKK